MLTHNICQLEGGIFLQPAPLNYIMAKYFNQLRRLLQVEGE